MLHRPLEKQRIADQYDPKVRAKKRHSLKVFTTVGVLFIILIVFRPTRAFLLATIFDNPALSSITGIMVLLLGGIEANTRSNHR